MAKVYVEHNDGHSGPRILTFGSEDEAVEHIMRAEGLDPDSGNDYGYEIRSQMFDVSNENHCGEFSYVDRWSIMDWDIAKSRSDYWARVAGQIAHDEKVT